MDVDSEEDHVFQYATVTPKPPDCPSENKEVTEQIKQIIQMEIPKVLKTMIPMLSQILMQTE